MTSQNKSIQTYKKVLYIGGFELPDKNAAAHRVLSISKMMRDLGYDVTLVGVNKELQWGTDIFTTKSNVQGFETYAVPYPKSTKQWLKYLSDIHDYISVIEADKSFNVVCMYNFPAIGMKAFQKYCMLRGMKSIADVTEWYSAKGRGLAYLMLKGADTCLRMRFFHKQLDGLILISKYLSNYYRKHRNAVYLPPLVDSKEEKWNHLQEKNPDSVLRLVYAGSPIIKDRIDVLITATKKINRPFHLDVVGLTKVQYLERVPTDKVYLADIENIVFHGQLTHIETLNYVSQADYSCFFRDSDRMTMAGFSTKFVEAISAGTPVLTNATSNLRDYSLAGKNTLLLDSITPDVIADAINKAPKSMLVDRKTFDYRGYQDDLKTLFDNL